MVSPLVILPENPVTLNELVKKPVTLPESVALDVVEVPVMEPVKVPVKLCTPTWENIDLE